MKIAIWQALSTPGDLKNNIDRLNNAAQQAAANGAELLITPEMFITGYNIGQSVVPMAHKLAAENLLGPIALEHGIALIVGEPVCSQDGIYNAATFFSADGQVIESYHKTHLFGALDRAMFVPGQLRPRVFEYRGIRFAMLICYDVEFPETVRECAMAGADVIVVPTAQMMPFVQVNDHVIPARAWENQVYIAYVNQHGSDGELTYVGRSLVVAPDGRCLAKAPPSGEVLLYAEVSSHEVAIGRDKNPYLSDLRRDLY